jgi:2-succinyl-5-enolpyruvyl-6-hydroxy-3-cyclohexene-1-carboxylate synthase
VVDNNGGGIFSTLSQRGVEGFEEVFGTPHNLDLVALARTFGISGSTVATKAELLAEIAKPVIGLSVVVVKVPDRESNADSLQRIYKSISSM